MPLMQNWRNDALILSVKKLKLYLKSATSVDVYC